MLWSLKQITPTEPIMSTFQAALDAFISRNSLVNAKSLVAHARKFPKFVDMLSEDHAGQVRNAERIVADAKEPAKIREAMQTELRARYKNLNITVI